MLFCGSFGSFRLGCGLLGLQLIERETNECLLDSLSPSGSLPRIGLRLALLVHLSPGLSPVELHGPYSLSEQRSDLVANEEVNLPILSNKALALSRIDAVVSELTEFSFDNHLLSETTEG